MHDVFISYSSKDMEYAYNVRAQLTKHGISCWMAPESITAGSNYTKEIPLGIRDCTVFLLLLSNHAMASRWVLKELDTAINKGKQIIPFMIDNCTLTDEFEFMLTGYQCIFSWKPNALTNLTNQILVYAGRPPVVQAPAVPPVPPVMPAPAHHIPRPVPVPPPASKKKKHAGPLIAILLAALLIGGGSLLSILKQNSKLQASYQVAETLLSDGDYEGAVEIFRNLGDYRDAAQRAMALEQLQVDYEAALALLNNQQFAEAAKLFRALGDYRDSLEYAVNKVPYAEASYLAACAKDAVDADAVSLYEQAAHLYLSLNGYGDSADQAGSCLLNAAEILLNYENYDQALAYLDLLSEADGNTLRSMYAETCADAAFLLDIEKALEIWLDAPNTYSFSEEIDLAWKQVDLYQQAHFDDSRLPVLLEDFHTALETVEDSLDSDDTVGDYAGFYLGIYRLCVLAETLQQDYLILTDNTSLQQFFIGTGNHYYALHTLEASFEAWWASDLSDTKQYDSGNYYTVYTNDTNYSFDLVASIYYFDANSNQLDLKEITVHVPKGGTVSIPLKPNNVSMDECATWRLLWDFTNIT